ncbi:CLUMA_CG018764, isoform A [Clunio marinus]|uniref:CLUMA_CG018764, isoform A n=1 Tax=Clunio marinus TaxID=568069 RepID=A0A1J1J014_9DIPT|nr:CLUMA_CG018764, isoform A [Clunio marinus]
MYSDDSAGRAWNLIEVIWHCVMFDAYSHDDITCSSVNIKLLKAFSASDYMMSFVHELENMKTILVICFNFSAIFKS